MLHRWHTVPKSTHTGSTQCPSLHTQVAHSAQVYTGDTQCPSLHRWHTVPKSTHTGGTPCPSLHTQVAHRDQVYTHRCHTVPKCTHTGGTQCPSLHTQVAHSAQVYTGDTQCPSLLVPLALPVWEEGSIVDFNCYWRIVSVVFQFCQLLLLFLDYITGWHFYHYKLLIFVSY
jgi:hypothetical protein